MELITEQMTT